MPQLDVATFPSQLFWLAVTFVVLYILMSWIGLPRLSAAIDARRQRREDDLARAAQLKTEAEAANAAFQRTMAEARAQAQAAIKETTDRLAAEAAERQRALAAALAAADRRSRAPHCRDKAAGAVRGSRHRGRCRAGGRRKADRLGAERRRGWRRRSITSCAGRAR